MCGCGFIHGSAPLDWNQVPGNRSTRTLPTGKPHRHNSRLSLDCIEHTQTPTCSEPACYMRYGLLIDYKPGTSYSECETWTGFTSPWCGERKTKSGYSADIFFSSKCFHVWYFQFFLYKEEEEVCVFSFLDIWWTSGATCRTQLQVKTKAWSHLFRKWEWTLDHFLFFSFFYTCFQGEIRKLLSPRAFKRTLPSVVHCFGLYSSLSGAAQRSRTLAVQVMTRPNLLSHPPLLGHLQEMSSVR